MELRFEDENDPTHFATRDNQQRAVINREKRGKLLEDLVIAKGYILLSKFCYLSSILTATKIPE